MSSLTVDQIGPIHPARDTAGRAVITHAHDPHDAALLDVLEMTKEVSA